MKPTQHWLVIPTSFLIAIILTLLPMPAWTIWMRPAWVLMVLIYWAMVSPYRVNMGTAWVVGILLDVLNGTLLGEHALALSVVTYFVVRMHTQLRMYPLLQQGMWIFLFVLIYQFILFCIQGFLGEMPKTWLYWSSSATSMLLWPWVFVIMRDYQRRYKTSL
ncbi:MAG: rod shape-determining protein MreD [Gammaproteobacteria bacterium]|nr:rod shape-determining protein MreD [Gammaproteobacteria bacterium]